MSDLKKNELVIFNENPRYTLGVSTLKDIKITLPPTDWFYEWNLKEIEARGRRIKYFYPRLLLLVIEFFVVEAIIMYIFLEAINYIS